MFAVFFMVVLVVIVVRGTRGIEFPRFIRKNMEESQRMERGLEMVTVTGEITFQDDSHDPGPRPSFVDEEAGVAPLFKKHDDNDSVCEV